MTGLPRNRLLPQREVEQDRGDPAAHQARGRSPVNVLRPPEQFANAAAVFAARRRAVVKPANAATFLRVFANVAAGVRAINVLPQNLGFRNALIIRNASTSAGALLVGLGYAPTGVLDCDVELAPGAYLFQDYAPSQDDIWLFSTAGASASIAYSVR